VEQAWDQVPACPSITPRTMYVSHVLGPQAAIDLFKRTGSTSSDAVPSPDAATGDQMRAWARQLRLGTQAAGLPPTPDSIPPSVSAPMQFGSVGAAAPNPPNEDADAPGFPSVQPFA
jgi:hypothetical protein